MGRLITRVKKQILGGELGQGCSPASHISLQRRFPETSESTIPIYFESTFSYTMADPTKAETDQVFKVLKAGKGNKVRAPRLCGKWPTALLDVL